MLGIPLLFPVLASDGQNYDYVDNNTSNVDSLADLGSHSNFTAQQQGPDSEYDTLTEGNTGGSLQNATLLEDGFEDTVDWDVNWDGNGVTDWNQVTDQVHSGTYSAKGATGDTWLTSDDLDCSDAQAIYVDFWIRKDDTDPNEFELYFFNGTFYVLYLDLDTLGGDDVWIHYQKKVTNSQYLVSNFRIRFECTGINYRENVWVDDVLIKKETSVDNYELDLEVQWTNATYDLPNEELRIFGGIMGSEDIRVDAWNGSTWHNLFTDLSSGWNNVSVTDYLVSPTFTLRFKGGTETGDTSQDSWEIDSTLLHTWGIAPIANFSYTPEYPYTGETVTFNASSSYDPDGTIVSYFWDFGDDTNGTGEIISHTYADDGIYTVTLTVTDNDGLSDTTSADVTVLNRPPVASFIESAETVLTSETIYFNASACYDPDGIVISYFWDFGDGSNATGVTVEHAYADNGTYTVTLTVTDDDGAIDTTTSTKAVLNRPPVASFTESAETVYTSETITFNASSSYDPDGIIVSYFWDFGDGGNATGFVVNHAYTDDGIYTVTLTVTDDDSTATSTYSTKTVLNRPPVAVFTESTETVYADEPITFNASDSYDPDGTIVSYFWDFGDGSNDTGIFVSHFYADNGIYTVTLTVTDDDGSTDTTTATKTVLNQPPVASFTESAETVYTSEVIYFNASASYDPDGTIVIYFWDFGDGANASGVTVTHAYADDGSYAVTLTVTDNDGATDTATATKTIMNRSPVAVFTESAETVYVGEAITFNASDSYDLDGTIISFFWDFGDGTNTTGILVEHTYSVNGTYLVTLTVTDDDGASDSTSSTKTILLNEPPVALFTESAETVYTSETIYFNASSSYDLDGSIVGYFWDFGDSDNASGVTAEHAYVNDGIYTATLTVTDNRGATSTTSSTKTVLNRSPTALFTESAETIYTDESITFNATSSYDPDGTIASYFWNFSDGTNATGMIVTHSYADNGTYVVTLTVTDDDGATASANATKTILNRAPVAMFTESAESVNTGEGITLNATNSYDSDGYIASYFWDFGDGTNATGVVVEHAYVDDGIYTVTLKVTDDDGATDTTTATKTIMNRSPVAVFTESAETVYTAETITFNASNSYDPDGTIASYFWDFGDGTNNTGIIVEHAYADDGTYTVSLTVTDDDGGTNTSTSTKTVLNRPPVASFTESTETVYTSETITFNASSSFDPDGAIASYFWDFGDGTNATGVITNHSYVNSGTYTVTLTVTDDDGASGTATSTKIALNRPPVASFTESAATVNTGETITFNATDSYDPDGYIVSYFWDFGDGTNASGMVVNHAYADNGAYPVTLTVTDDDGATASTTATKTILNKPPVASFTESAETIYTSETITFNASDSYDSDGTIVSYFWDFGDGTNATGIVVQHSYSEDGVYTITLTVTDDDGAVSTATATKTVLNRPPVATLTESAETVYTGELITFNSSESYDPDGYIASYFWDFGDGSNTTGIVVSHVYVDDGDYTVTLVVTDDDGDTATATATKTILNRSPVASFTESAEVIYTGNAIVFNASESYDPDGTIVDYYWTFGDGTNTTGTVVTHAYLDNGTYTVTLRATDDDGAIDTVSAVKTILNRPPIANFTESAETVFTGEVITFNASDSYDSDGYIVSYFWDFGDGTNATGMIVVHSYVDNGTYTVTLTVTDDDGASASTSSTKSVLNRPPVASFTESAEAVYTGETITFNASNSYDPDGSIVGYFWDFGDGSNATGITVEHAYVEDNNYAVTLVVTDNDGATASTSAVKTILNKPPIASFTESATTVLTGGVITFDASSSYDPDGSVVSYFWDFGDGTNATGITIGHAYADDGNITVTLIVTDNDGATSNSTATKSILNRSPIAIFTTSATTVLTSQNIRFNASDSYDSDGVIVSFFWDFGDGTNATGMTVENSYVDDGTFIVTLTVTDDDNATGIATSTIHVNNRPPIAVFTESAETVYNGDAITFNASSSYDPDGLVVSFFWDFGDGTNATGIETSHVFTENSNYTVTLTVTDNDGATDITQSTKTVLNRPPIAVFTESTVTVLIGESITFNASASFDPDGSIVSYFWDFGDGANATGVTTQHSYSSSGVYTVTLTVTDDEGEMATTTATKTVEITPPVALFTESNQTASTNEPITFNASDSYDSDGVIVSFFWDFGDGTNATGVTAEHSYSTAGNYTVTLEVTDNDGATDTATATKTISNRLPTASFTESAETVYTGEIISFNASDSYDPDGVIVGYFWDFGDGANATGVTAAHSYVDNGNYTVILTITDNNGATANATSTKTILNSPPVAIFSESSETAYVGHQIAFNASDSYDSDGVIVGYFWDFGDGANASGVSVDHAYVVNGTFTVTLIITDDDEASTLTNSTKTILWNMPPVAIFTESSESIYQGESIAFNASSSYDLDGIIVSYFWDFGDGTNATGITVEHTYLDDGDYTVTLSITDNVGETDNTSSTKTVLNMVPIASFTESAETVYTSEIITFNASSSYDPDGLVVSFFWDFGDGTNATGITATHAFIEDGSYTVTLTVTDDDEAKTSTSSIKTILNRSPVALFTVSPQGAYTGEIFTFNASDSYDPDGFIINFFWDFGDGNTDYGEVVTHTYADDGRYTATLTVADNDIAQETATGIVIVSNRAPAAIFVESTETSYVGTTIEFDASASYDSDGVIVGYFWDFGDGANASGVSVDHAYVVNGTFSVTLAVTDDNGASSITQATKSILENEQPVASFTESAETVYTGEIVVFNASTSYDADGTIINYSWDFGDGVETTGVLVQHSYIDDGTYTVTLTVTDDQGAPSSVTATKTVLNRLPISSFTESLETAYSGENIEFDASASYDSDGVIVGYFWDFGDGANASGVSVDHAYVVNGTFSVTLTVTDDDGASSITQATKTILGGVRDVAVINVDPSVREIYKHNILNVSVVVANEGAEFETFNVTLYSAEIHGWHLIEVGERLLWFSDGENSGNFILTTPITIPLGNPMLTFETKYDLENLYDFGFVQISLDEGTSWISLENAYTTHEHADTDPNIISNLPGFTGTSANWPVWTTMTFDLSQYAGEDVLLGFRYMTDLGHLEQGWYLDNVTINGAKIPNQAFEQLSPSTSIAIETITVYNMSPGTQTTLIFSWNTSNTRSGYYSISAAASVVRGENETMDNIFVNGPVEIKMNPDMDDDGDVDIFDVVVVTSIYGCREGELRWNPRADLVEDGIINIYDVVYIASNYGQTITTP